MVNKRPRHEDAVVTDTTENHNNNDSVVDSMLAPFVTLDVNTHAAHSAGHCQALQMAGELCDMTDDPIDIANATKWDFVLIKPGYPASNITLVADPEVHTDGSFRGQISLNGGPLFGGWRAQTGHPTESVDLTWHWTGCLYLRR